MDVIPHDKTRMTRHASQGTHHKLTVDLQPLLKDYIKLGEEALAFKGTHGKAFEKM